MEWYNNELYHFGIKGMKWGVRRYQNKDGTLTPAGKKRVSEEYKKYAAKAQTDLENNYNNRWLKAYNKAADDMNNGLTDKYNSDYDKKLGSKAKDHDYFNDDEYNSGYEKLFNEQWTKHYNQETAREMMSNPNYKKAQKLCDKYNMTSFDDLAKTNAEAIKEMRKMMGG